MAQEKRQLDRKQENAIVALLAQRNVEEAANAVKVPPRTLYRWLKEPKFQAAYRQARRQAFGQAVARLQQISGAAVATLGKIMVDPQAPAASRVRAAHTVLEHAAKAIEIEDLNARVAALEASLDPVPNTEGPQR